MEPAGVEQSGKMSLCSYVGRLRIASFHSHFSRLVSVITYVLCGQERAGYCLSLEICNQKSIIWASESCINLLRLYV